MNATNARPYLLQRTLQLFVVLAGLLILLLWGGKTFVERQSERIYLDSQRLESLRTFEQAIVVVRTPSDYTAPTADDIRKHFAFCNLTDTSWRAAIQNTLRILRADSRASSSNARDRACRSDDPHEELACYLRTIDSKMNALGRDGRRD